MLKSRSNQSHAFADVMIPAVVLARQVTKFLNKWVVKSESAGYSSQCPQSV